MRCNTAPCTACPLSATQGTLNLALAWLPNANLQLPCLSTCALHGIFHAGSGCARHLQGFWISNVIPLQVRQAITSSAGGTAAVAMRHSQAAYSVANTPCAAADLRHSALKCRADINMHTF